MNSGRAVIITLGLLVFLVIFDGVVTNILINSDIAREGNPIISALAGTNKLVWVKIAGALISALILYDVWRHWPKAAAIAIYSFTAFYLAVVGWNIILWIIA